MAEMELRFAGLFLLRMQLDLVQPQRCPPACPEILGRKEDHGRPHQPEADQLCGAKDASKNNLFTFGAQPVV
jgi:hypothetical protein